MQSWYDSENTVYCPNIIHRSYISSKLKIKTPLTVHKMYTVGLTHKKNNFSFIDVELHTVFATPLSYCISVNLKSFTVFRRLYVSIDFQIISKYEKFWVVNYSRKSLIKMLNKWGPKMEPYSTPDNTQKKKNS